MSDTPRTDAKANEFNKTWESSFYEMRDLSTQLERELREARELLEVIVYPQLHLDRNGVTEAVSYLMRHGKMEKGGQ
jgi:hypothetical protein